MKILSILAVTLSAGTLFAQAPEQALDGRIQVFAELSRPVGITIVNGITDQPNSQTGVGVRFLGELASIPNVYYELGGKAQSTSRFTYNRDIGGGIDQFWLTGALRIDPVQQVDFVDRLRRGALPLLRSAKRRRRGACRRPRKRRLARRPCRP